MTAAPWQPRYKAQTTDEPAPVMSLRSFLEDVHPGITTNVTDLTSDWNALNDAAYIKPSEIRMHCGSEDCGRAQRFMARTSPIRVSSGVSDIYVSFSCRNCGISIKTFALRIDVKLGGPAGYATKIGEIPGFGIKSMPPRFMAFLGSSRELYFRGRRCESLGMGIGAFTYYRRVVDDQRVKLFDALIDVCTAHNISPELVAQLQAAKKETRFSTAVDTIKAALPGSLFIEGHSPLSLLYAALSEGVHELSDEDCLTRAHAIRLVLTELLDRVATLLTDDKELKAAVTSLLPKPVEKT